MFPLIRFLLLTYMGCILPAQAAFAVSAPRLLSRPEIISIAAADVPSTATASVVVATSNTRAAAVTALPAVKAGRPLKTLVRRLAFVEEPPQSKPAPAAAQSMTLSAFLRSRLGSRYHYRSEWAGHFGAYRPRVTRWRVWEPLGKVNYITIHHADGVPDEHPAAMIRNIYRGHTNAGGRLDAPDVGYHFFIDSDGGIWEGRDARKLGTHVGSTPDGLNNAGNLGVCGLGTYLHESPPRAMSRAAVELCDLIAEYNGRPLIVRGHKDWLDINRFHPYGGVDCPGRLEPCVRQANLSMASRFGKKGPTQLARSN